MHFRRVETKTGPVVHSIVFFAIDWVQETKGSLSAYARRFFARRGGPPREVEVVEVESQWTARDRETQARGGRDRVFLYQVGVQKKPTRTRGTSLTVKPSVFAPLPFDCVVG